MPFTIPVFNLTVNIYRNATWPPPVTPDIVTVGNLAYGRTRPDYFTWSRSASDTILESVGLMRLMLPAGTDIRFYLNSTDFDRVEVPAGSGRYYAVRHVDDVGKGFANEFRIAIVSFYPPVPTPIP